MPVFNHTAHKKLWEYLAECQNFAKRAAIEELKLPMPRYFACYACDYAAGVYVEKNKIDTFQMYLDIEGLACEFCPLQWPKGQTCRTDITFLEDDEIVNQYLLWIDLDEDSDVDMVRQLAEEIRDLPVKEGVETI